MQFQIVPVTPYQQNCSLIWCETTKEAAFIDPGGEVDKLMAEVQRRELKLSKILLTHGHLDHVGGTAQLSQAMSLPIEGPHQDDDFWIQQLDQQAQLMGLAQVPGFTSDRWLNDGDVVTVGECELSVHHCPGHTPGHVVFYHKASQVAFVGDVLFQGSIGRTDFPRGNYDQLINSIRTKLWPLGDDVRFVPGHGAMSTFGLEREHNAFVADTRFG